MSRTAKARGGKSKYRLLARLKGLRIGRAWQIAVAIVVVVVVIFGARALWQNVRPHVEQQREYLVELKDLEITPPPAWIRADIKTEAIRAAGLPPRLSILDDNVSDRISQAFALHPWVAKVAGVQISYPPRVQVQLVYRKPVAMVEVYGGLLPVDAEGVLLPTEDFSPAEAQKYPRVAGVASSPLGALGTCWGDETIDAAARLAAILQDAWSTLALRCIRADTSRGRNAKGTIFLDLMTRGGTVLLWGSAPGDEEVGEIKAAEKLNRLLQLADSMGSLDVTPAAQADLRR